jgi:hypothetical protein
LNLVRSPVANAIFRSSKNSCAAAETPAETSLEDSTTGDAWAAAVGVRLIAGEEGDGVAAAVATTDDATTALLAGALEATG